MPTRLDPLGTTAASLAVTASAGQAARRQSDPPQASGLGQPATGGLRDLLDISREAREAWLASRQSTTQESVKNQTADTWESLFRLQSGTTTLKNGNKQVTTINGSELLVMEYEGDRLVRKETGTLGSGSIVKDIEYYDEAGRLAQSVHSELASTDGSGFESSAVLTRSASWYSGDALVREYTDSMELSAGYDEMPSFDLDEEDLQDLTSLAGAITKDNVTTHFNATVRDYMGGRLAQSATVRQNTSLELRTNRTASVDGGQAAWTTQGLGGESGFSATVTNYDFQGRLLREASFEEEIDKTGKKTQRLSTSWYNNGELVRKSTGEFEGQVQSGRGINAQLFLDTLGMTQGQYSSQTPQTAGELLTKNFQKAAEAPEFYTQDVDDMNGQGVFGSARNLMSFQNAADPFSLTWTDETYVDGTLAARSVDTEAARENPDARGVHFGLLTGLTEDRSPRLLRESSHTDEGFDEHGDVQTSAVLKRIEEVTKDDRGVYHLWTRTTGLQEGGGEPLSVTAREERPLSEVDKEAGKASLSFDAAAELTLNDVTAMLAGLEEPGAGTQEAREKGVVIEL